MEERARVVAVADGVAWVEKERQTQCGGCSLRNGCGSAVLSKVLGARRNRIQVINPLPARIGDVVVIRLDEAALLRVSFAVYMMPLFSLFVGATVGKFAFAPMFSGYADGVVVLFAMVGLFVGALWLRQYSRRIASDSKYQPVIERVVGTFEPILTANCPS